MSGTTNRALTSYVRSLSKNDFGFTCAPLSLRREWEHQGWRHEYRWERIAA
jgi:hypothetical protein